MGEKIKLKEKSHNVKSNALSANPVCLCAYMMCLLFNFSSFLYMVGECKRN